MKQLLIMLVVSISNACIPTTPVSTTTVAPNATTTTPYWNSSSTTTTTSTVATTTAQDACCSWPIAPTNVNTVSPNYTDWSCNQTIMYLCGVSYRNDTVGAQLTALAVSLTNTSAITNANTRGQTNSNETISATLTCDTTTHLWNLVGYSGQYSYFSCAYTLNGGTTWYRSVTEAFAAG